jgi:hypothetical protein
MGGGMTTELDLLSSGIGIGDFTVYPCNLYFRLFWFVWTRHVLRYVHLGYAEAWCNSLNLLSNKASFIEKM